MTSDLAATPAPVAEFQSPVAPRRRWRLRGRQPEGDLATAPYPPLIRHLLWHRGVRTPAEAAAFIDGAVVEYDPMLLPDIEPALHKLHAQGVTLIVTSDCGTSSVAAVAHARKLDIDTIILDHHAMPPELPAAVALVNPKRAENRYPV